MTSSRAGEYKGARDVSRVSPYVTVTMEDVQQLLVRRPREVLNFKLSAVMTVEPGKSREFYKCLKTKDYDKTTRDYLQQLGSIYGKEVVKDVMKEVWDVSRRSSPSIDMSPHEPLRALVNFYGKEEVSQVLAGFRDPRDGDEEEDEEDLLADGAVPNSVQRKLKRLATLFSRRVVESALEGEGSSSSDDSDEEGDTTLVCEDFSVRLAGFRPKLTAHYSFQVDAAAPPKDGEDDDTVPGMIVF